MTDKQFRFARTSQCYCLGQRENACSKANCTRLKSMISSRGGIRGRESFSLPKMTAALYPAWETWMAPNVRPMSVGN